MKSSTLTSLPSTPLADKLLRLHLVAAIRRYGIRVVEDGNTVCPACFVQIAVTPLWLIRKRPILCDSCGYVLVNSHAQRQTLLTAVSLEVLR